LALHGAWTVIQQSVGEVRRPVFRSRRGGLAKRAGTRAAARAAVTTSTGTGSESISAKVISS
jgi:hypothetical protein